MRVEPRLILFGLAALAAAVAPLAPRSVSAPADRSSFPGWPAAYEGRALTPVPLSARDAGFSRGFPGRVARFTDGRRQIVLRWVDGPTRRLHPAAECYRAMGWRIEPLPMGRTADGADMSCFRAARPGEALRICERVVGFDGRSWPDVSAWWWSAVTWPGGGGAWSWVTAERDTES